MLGVDYDLVRTLSSSEHPLMPAEEYSTENPGISLHYPMDSNTGDKSKYPSILAPSPGIWLLFSKTKEQLYAIAPKSFISAKHMKIPYNDRMSQGKVGRQTLSFPLAHALHFVEKSRPSVLLFT